MTEAQRCKFYFPVWTECARANGWVMEQGRLAVNLTEQLADCVNWDDPAREQHRKAVCAAIELSEADHSGVTAKHLRHGCNVAATGLRSCRGMSNKQVNRTVNLFRLLRDPLDLWALCDWLNPAMVEKRGFISFLEERVHEGVLRAISSNAFATGDYESLEIGKLRWIARTVKHRNRREGMASGVLGPGKIQFETDAAKCPF